MQPDIEGDFSCYVVAALVFRLGALRFGRGVLYLKP